MCSSRVTRLHTGNMLDVDRQWFALCADAVIDGPKAPLLLGGMRFDEQRPCAPHWAAFADASFHLAHWLLSEATDGCWLRCQQVLEPDSDPQTLARDSIAAYAQLLNPPAATATAHDVIERNALPSPQWQGKVDIALQAISRGDLNKVVLARHIEYQLSAPLDSGAAPARTRQRLPTVRAAPWRALLHGRHPDANRKHH
ncbi:hypothetical protein [Pseudomonas canadensis]|uniref:hypothetical protein n=1 Tax=Pseudomonas canadensis TaxID=915099 RepID=UPI0028117518|nr:hypothetical protein [Pseudomonas canadensis]